jgi:hypothetical protein
MTTLQLANLDARLAYLAAQYHLSRPGSELDPETKLPTAHGLGGLAEALEPQLDRAVVAVELNGDQHRRLLEAVAGATNELKSAALLSAGGRPGASRFHEALRRLFPEVAEDPDEATPLAGHMLELRRKLERLDVAPAPQNESPASRPGRWRFWERRGA